MSALDDAHDALRKRQEAADDVLRISQERADTQGSRALASETYLKATVELADQWLRLAAIEAGHNGDPAMKPKYCKTCGGSIVGGCCDGVN